MLKLQAQIREKLGKKAKNLLGGGFIPAELYGRGFENKHVKVKESEFMDVYNRAGESSIVTIELEGQAYPVLIYDVQKDLLGEHIQHIDFYVVKMDEKITTSVPLIFVGEAPAVKEFGGLLITSTDSVEVQSLPMDLPHQIEVDLSVLAELHSNIRIGDLATSDVFEIITDPETVIVSVSEPRVEEEPEEKEMTPDDVEVEKKGKQEDSSEEENKNKEEKISSEGDGSE